MKDSDAIDLIKGAIPYSTAASTWADLGSGNGTFTKALAELLPAGSFVYAIDKEDQQISSLNQVTIQFRQTDFTNNDTLPVNLDGVLIANALHYIKDQLEFFRMLKPHLKDNGRFIVIEYDTDQSNQWIPYPVKYILLKEMLFESGFKYVEKVNEKNSIFNSSKIYSCVAY